MDNRRRTKIVTTLGPATDPDRVLTAMLRAGVDVVRINFSHGAIADHRRRVEQVRRISTELGIDVAVLGDLQGPKIRIERFRDGPIELVEGARFSLDADLPADAGSAAAVGVSHKALPQDVRAGDVLLLDDGQIVLDVEAVEGRRVVTKVRSGGKLSDHKGINREGGGLSAGTLTDKDRQDIVHAAELGVDYIAVSFTRSADDIQEARRLLRAAGGDGRIVAKIERAEAVANIESILEASDAVMVARGDLGVEMGYAELTGLQKSIIRMARHHNRVAITATQMMESMIASPLPTRAEVTDVANAVMDGSDAVMLSAETAVGRYPVKAVEAMASICLGAEKHQLTHTRSRHRLDSYFSRTDEAIAMAVMYTANHLDVKAIIALTESGSTTLWMSRIRSDIPIYAFTRHEATRRRVKLYRGVYAVAFDVVHTEAAVIYRAIFEQLLNLELVDEGDLVILTKGDTTGVSGHTNAMKILQVSRDGPLATPLD